MDVALLLEETYPFVRGPVASWVHRLIEAMPDNRFAVAFLGGRRSVHRLPAYEVPANVLRVDCQDLFEPPHRERWGGRTRRGELPDVEGLHRALRTAGAEEPIDAALPQILTSLVAEPGARADGGGYLRTIRAMNTSVFAVSELARRLPPARCYHAVSTGHAGLLGTILRHRHRRPFILTEHGHLHPWKRDAEGAASIPGDGAAPDAPGFERRQWMRFLQGLGTIAYASADAIVSLDDGSRRRQIEDGADPARTRVVPSGVDVDWFRAMRDGRPAEPIPVLGLMGPIVPSQDVKSFLHAMKVVVTERPDAQAWIAGATGENRSYVAECVQLAAALGLESRVRFAGYQPAAEVLPRLGLLVLTSRSEGLPLVALEAFASGLPAVATDVTACRNLIEGSTPADRALGPAGAVVPVGDPQATARAALSLLGDGARWRDAQRAAVRRVETYYTERRAFETYRRIYREAVAWPT